MEALVARLWLPSLQSQGTHVKPTVKTAATPTFLFLVMCSFQTDFTGTNRIIISVMVLKSPLVLRRLEMSIQVPGTDLFHILFRGVHSHILTIVVAM